MRRESEKKKERKKTKLEYANMNYKFHSVIQNDNNLCKSINPKNYNQDRLEKS